MNLNLSARQPFNFLSVVNSHGWVQLAPFRYDESRQVLSYTDRLSNGRVIDQQITETPKGITVEIKGRLGKAEQKEITNKVSWMFGLDQDFNAFYKTARKEPKLSRAQKTGARPRAALAHFFRRCLENHTDHQHAMGGDQTHES